MLLLCSLLPPVNHLVEAVHFFRQKGLVSPDLDRVSLLVGLRQVSLLGQRSVGARSNCSHLSNPRIDLLEHLLTGSELLVIFVKPLFFLGQCFLLNLVVKQFFEEPLLLSLNLVVLMHIHLVVHLSSGGDAVVLGTLTGVDFLKSNIIRRSDVLSGGG